MNRHEVLDPSCFRLREWVVPDSRPESVAEPSGWASRKGRERHIGSSEPDLSPRKPRNLAEETRRRKDRKGNSSKIKETKAFQHPRLLVHRRVRQSRAAKATPQKRLARGLLGAAYQMRPQNACILQFCCTTPSISRDRIVERTVMVRHKGKANKSCPTLREALRSGHL